MPDLTAKRTLVKSPPELWEELSEVERLAKHLGAFGDITITKLEPEHTVAWEGEHASGTVSLEPSGWGTTVILHAELPDAAEPEAAEPEAAEPEAAEPEAAEPEAAEPEAAEPEREPVESDPVAVKPEPEGELAEQPPEAESRRRGFWGWLFRSRTDREPNAAPASPTVGDPDRNRMGGAEWITQPTDTAERDAGEPESAEPVAAESVATEPVAAEPVAAEPAAAEPDAGEPESAEPIAAEPVAAEPVAAEPDPAAPEPDAADGAASLDPKRAMVVLDEALDALGAAHHRPFSRG